MRASIYGERPEFISAYDAFIQEQIEINTLVGLIGKPSLFTTTFEEEKRPLEFATMLRPTRRQYREFAQVLDKMLSENLNRDFFKGDIPPRQQDELLQDAIHSLTRLRLVLSAHPRAATYSAPEWLDGDTIVFF